MVTASVRPKRWLPRRQWVCERKRPYNTEAEAQSWLKEIGLIEEMNVYECKFCSWWHIGHKRKERGYE